jgi:hypothetical protein
MVRAGGVAGRPEDMAKSSEWRTDFGRFWLRRGIGFAGLDGCKECAMPGVETGESKSREFDIYAALYRVKARIKQNHQKSAKKEFLPR